MKDKIIIFFHIYYVNLIDEYLFYINKINNSDYSYDLYISICKEVCSDDIINKLKKFKNDVIITQCENLGADSGGFINTLRNNEINLDLYIGCLYIHTKQSAHCGNINSYIWRSLLLNDILITEKLVNYCIAKINSNGIIGSNRCISLVKESIYMESERIYYKQLCNRLNIDPDINSYFVAGTIFWANINIIKEIQKSDISLNDFQNKFMHHGLMEHSFERFFGTISNKLNLPILGMNINVKNNIHMNEYKNLKIHGSVIYNNFDTFQINESINISYIEDIIKEKKLLSRKKKLLSINK
jgi:lipopolysaccharide biosynthesis protein